MVSTIERFYCIASLKLAWYTRSLIPVIIFPTYQINRVIVRAENTEDPDRAFYELEACVPVQSDMTECFRSGITIYAIPDPIGMYYYMRREAEITMP